MTYSAEIQSKGKGKGKVALLGKVGERTSSITEDADERADDLASAIKESIHSVSGAVDPFSRCCIESISDVGRLASQGYVESADNSIGVVLNSLPVGDEAAAATNVVQNAEAPITDIAFTLRIVDADEVGNGAGLDGTLCRRGVSLLVDLGRCGKGSGNGQGGSKSGSGELHDG